MKPVTHLLIDGGLVGVGGLELAHLGALSGDLVHQLLGLGSVGGAVHDRWGFGGHQNLID